MDVMELIDALQGLCVKWSSRLYNMYQN